MIEWKVYVPEKTRMNKIFLVTNGTYIDAACLDYNQTNGYAWWDKAGYKVPGVTHFAEYNLPLVGRLKEDTNEH